CVQAIVFPYSF
nr:immunoglobulin light chain junction region [Macaca mulatta]